MNFDLNLIPQTFDMLHAGLTASSVLLLLIAVSRKSKVVEKVVEKPVEKIVEVEKIECIGCQNIYDKAVGLCPKCGKPSPK